MKRPLFTGIAVGLAVILGGSASGGASDHGGAVNACDSQSDFSAASPLPQIPRLRLNEPFVSRPQPWVERGIRLTTERTDTRLDSGQLKLRLDYSPSPEMKELLNTHQDRVVLIPVRETVQVQRDKKGTTRTVEAWKLIALGLGLAGPEFFLNTGVHEASHAVVLKALGYEVTAFRPYPHMRKARDGTSRFYFGSVTYRRNGPEKKGEWISDIAPQIVDVAVLSTYYALLETDSLPRNKFAKMAILMLPVGSLVDMLNHARNGVLWPDPTADFTKFKSRIGADEGAARVVADGLQLALVAGGAYVVARGLIDVFKPEKAESAPSGKSKPKIQYHVYPTGNGIEALVVW